MKPNREGMMKKHGMCFTAVAVIVQLKLTIGGQSFFKDGLEYDVHYL